MAKIYSKHFQSKVTTGNEPIPGKNQVQNSDGNYVFKVDDATRFDRFLILGSEGGSYYASEHELTVDNANAVVRYIKANGLAAVGRIVEISESGRAAKNDPALFALAMAAHFGDDKTRSAAFESLPRVARIGTHLFTFLENVQGFRGWGRGLRRAVGNWYNDKGGDDLAYQMAKYRQRNGWSHRDALRLAHPNPATPAHQALFSWVTKKADDDKKIDNLPKIIEGFTLLQQAKTSDDVVSLLGKYPNISWEMIPTEFLGDSAVWEALLPNLPMMAMLRNLGRMTANGLIAPMSDAAKMVSSRFKNADAIRKARIHPISVLGALMTYKSGHGVKGSLSWEPVTKVIDALDDAFYIAFGNVTPTGKRLHLALDVSGSMGWRDIAGMPGLTPRVASAAMAMVTARVEERYVITGFSDKLVPIDISPRQRLDDVVKTTESVRTGSTDCSLPMVYAMEKSMPTDAFVVYTDSETNCNRIHPSQALCQYRKQTGIPAKLVVVGMVANKFTIADPDDAGMMDVVGFDTATPELISDFVK